MEADIQSHRLSTENWEQHPLPTSFNTQGAASLPRHYQKNDNIPVLCNKFYDMP